MKKSKTTLPREHTIGESVLYMAFDLSLKEWKLAFSDGQKQRQVTIPGGDLQAIHREIDKAKSRFKSSGEVKVISCYEAGRDGFYLHRYLRSQGIENSVIDAASIEVNRRSRRAKTDRIDAKSLVSKLIRHQSGEEKVWSVLRVPSVEAEDARRLHRELERMKKEQTMHRNRIKSLLFCHGIRFKHWGKVLSVIQESRLWDGTFLPEELKSELVREYARYDLVHKQILKLQREQEKRIAAGKTAQASQAKVLRSCFGVGPRSSWLVVHEYLGWRKFENRRQVAAGSGLAPTPYASGSSRKELGISKSGNRRVRAVMIELSWAWLRFQPGSKLSRWYEERFGEGGKRMRRIGIVALARRLLISFWKLLEYGELPEGAILRGN